MFDPADYPVGQREFPPMPTGGLMYSREDMVGMSQMPMPTPAFPVFNLDMTNIISCRDNIRWDMSLRNP